MSKSDIVKLLVDTGVVFTSIPRSILEKLDIKPLGRRKLKVYGGGIVEQDIGVVVLEYEDIVLEFQ